MPESPARPTRTATCPWRRTKISWSTSRTSGRSRTLRLMAGLWAASRALKGDGFCAVGDASFESRVRGRGRPGAWPRGRPESASSPGDPCAVGCWGRLAQIIARWVERSRAPRRRGGLPATEGSSCRVERDEEKEVGAGWFWPDWLGCSAALDWLPGWCCAAAWPPPPARGGPPVPASLSGSGCGAGRLVRRGCAVVGLVGCVASGPCWPSGPVWGPGRGGLARAQPPCGCPCPLFPALACPPALPRAGPASMVACCLALWVRAGLTDARWTLARSPAAAAARRWSRYRVRVLV